MPAVKWVRRWRDTGSKAARPQGGDKRSDRIEAHAEEVLGLVAERHDITLAEIASHLERRHDLATVLHVVLKQRAAAALLSP